MAGKFSSDRDAFIHWACTQEWATGSDGNAESPTGYFWQIDFSEPEVFGGQCRGNPEFDSLFDAWLETYGELAVPIRAVKESLVGHFVVVEDSQGFVSVTPYNDCTAKAMFHLLQKTYAEWEGANND